MMKNMINFIKGMGFLEWISITLMILGFVGSWVYVHTNLAFLLTMK